MNNNPQYTTYTNIENLQYNAKYKQVRLTLLVIIVCSLVNVFTLTFGDMYYLFSSFFTQLIALVGAEIYLMTEAIGALVIFAILGVISVVPYVLAYFFSKKHVGWMIAALALFSVDSLLFLIFFLLSLLAGDFSGIFDLIIRVYALWSLGAGVKYGLHAKSAPPYTPSQPYTPAAAQPADESAAISRTITVTRKKAFSGCAIRFQCYIDKQQVALFQNGQSMEFTVSGGAHELALIAENGVLANAIQIPAGAQNKKYVFRVKTGLVAGHVIITEEP